MDPPIQPSAPTPAPEPEPEGWVFDEVSRIENGRALLHDISLRIAWNERVVLTGPSGSGKTTLLRLLPRLDDPDGGELRLQGRPLSAHEPRGLRRQVRYIPQHPVALPGSVADNLECAARLVRSTSSRTRMESLLASLRLDPDLLDANVERLSGGELHRLAVARALMAAGASPGGAFFVLDEPAAHLDPESARAMLATVADAGGLLVADHHGLAHDLVGRAVRIEKGRIVADRPLGEGERCSRA